MVILTPVDDRRYEFGFPLIDANQAVDVQTPILEGLGVGVWHLGFRVVFENQLAEIFSKGIWD